VTYCSSCGGPLPQRPPVTCPACGAEHYRNAKPCAGALALRDGRLLLLKRANDPWSGRWDIPGGFCEATEHPMETAERETREETGLDIEITGFLGMWLDRYPDPKEAEYPIVTLNAYYHATVVSGAEGGIDPEEVSEIGWFEPDRVPVEIAFPNHAVAVLAAWRDAIRRGLTVTPLPDRPTG
jgi:8-oxo-dGTP diphosphatase